MVQQQANLMEALQSELVFLKKLEDRFLEVKARKKLLVDNVDTLPWSPLPSSDLGFAGANAKAR